MITLIISLILLYLVTIAVALAVVNRYLKDGHDGDDRAGMAIFWPFIGIYYLSIYGLKKIEEHYKNKT